MMLQESIKLALRRVKRHFQRIKWSRKAFPDWTEILKADHALWHEARNAAKDGPKVLLATSTGGHQHVTPIESMLAVALTLRGANVHFLLCDEFLPACLQAMSIEFWNTSSFARHGPKSLCSHCFQAGQAAYQPLGLPIHFYSRLVSSAEQKTADELSHSMPLAEIADCRLDGLAVGEHALAGTLRFFARGTLSDEPHGEAILRRYLKASLLTIYAVRRLLERFNFEVSCFHHGIYVPQGLIGEVSRQRGARVVNWVPAYRKQSFIFSHGDTYHHTLMSEPASVWEDITWKGEMEADVLDYLKSRAKGTHDWIYFHDKPQEDLAQITREIGIDFSKPTIGMLTNVVWDAQLHYPANAFPNMLDWIRQTIGYFAKRPNLQLLIRVHPAEIRGMLPSRQRVVDEIRKSFPVLPSNVFVIPPEGQISTYAAMFPCDSVIIYGTKTGVELSSFGMPIIVAGEAWIRNKGLTLDPQTVEEYFQILDRLPFGKRLDETTMRRARMYAYHFFFRRMIPLSFIRPASGWWPYLVEIAGLEDLLPGCDPGLDTICDGILNGANFVFPAEKFG